MIGLSRHILKKRDDGAMAIEFALSFPAFLLLVVGIMEFSWYLFLSGSLENAVLAASRFGIIGPRQEGESATDRFGAIRAVIEEETQGRIRPDDLDITTTVYEHFADIARDVGDEPWEDSNGDGVWNPGETYTDENGNGSWDPALGTQGVGEANEIVLYRVVYVPKSFTGMFDFATRLAPIEAAVAVRNEPYE